MQVSEDPGEGHAAASGDAPGAPVAASRSTGPGMYAGIGLQYAGTLVAFAFGGWYLDGKFGSQPWCLLLCVLLGFVGGTISLVHKVPPPGGRRPS